jgi:hypothetical protein
MKKLKIIPLIYLSVFVSMFACGKLGEPKIKETNIQADDVTLHIRIVGNKEAENVLISVHGGPGNSSDYMASLEKL